MTKGISLKSGWDFAAVKKSYPLAPGMCFSNEPMIVVQNAFGVRLEDHFHVTEDGAAWFTEPVRT